MTPPDRTLCCQRPCRARGVPRTARGYWRGQSAAVASVPQENGQERGFTPAGTRNQRSQRMAGHEVRQAPLDQMELVADYLQMFQSSIRTRGSHSLESWHYPFHESIE